MRLDRGTRAEIDLNAIASNINFARSIIQPSTKLCAVVKADAYGHGAVEIAKECVQQSVDYFAVALLEEGVLLRESGITKPILVLGAMPVKKDAAKMCVHYDIDHAVFDKERLQLLNAVAIRQNKQAGVHLAVDTGMNRIGIRFNELNEFIQTLKSCSGIRVDGVFSHFAEADISDKSYAKYQYGLFLNALSLIKEKGVDIPIRHICNSAGIVELPQYQLDMVRQGITLYGLRPAQIKKGYEKLKPAMTIKTTIAYIKHVPEGQYISYGCTYKTTRDSVIATLPIGYADGISRRLSNKGYVLIHGIKAPIVGRICMDQFMIDITDSFNVHVGDEVIVFGGPGIPIEDVAEWEHTNPNEIVCNISSRVPRVYVRY